MITHLFDVSRASHWIMQGILKKFPGQVSSNIDFLSGGRVVHVKSKNIFEDLKKSEKIFMGDVDFFHDFFNKESLWDRLIFYDYRDNTNLIKTIPRKVVYFKRSLFLGNERKPKKFDRKIYPISHCALDEYFLETCDKTYDIGCFFDINNENLGKRRRNLLLTLLKENLPNSLIGTSTGFANKARIAISKSNEKNFFYDFLKLQKQCKIIFTAQPELVDGDNRTWEALASGSLVFCERSLIPVDHPLIDGYHCLFFDANSIFSIKKAIEKAKYYLNNQLPREKIAKNGMEFTKKYHMGTNRVQQMLLVKKKLKFLL